MEKTSVLTNGTHFVGHLECDDVSVGKITIKTIGYQ